MIRWLARLTRKLGPGWLVKDELLVEGEHVETDSFVLFTTEMLIDSRLQRLRDGVLARFPGRGTMPADALQYAGRDACLTRGPAEPQEVYELRITGTIEHHKTLGNAWRLMEQIAAFCYPHAVRVRVWTERGDVYTRERDGTESVVRATEWNWDDSELENAWGRFWVLIYPTTDTPSMPWRRLYWGEPGLTWGSGYTWGSTATPADVQGIRSIVAACKPEGTTCKYILIVFADDAFDPAGADLPDGTWSTVSNAGNEGDEFVKRPTRSKDAIYWPGTRGPVAG